MKATNHILKNTLKKEAVESAYLQYIDSRNIRNFMECSSDYILTFIKRNLTDDEDIACEFFLNFYESAEKFMDKYESKETSPISAFIPRYLKNEFMNFIRKKRIRTFTELTGMDNILHTIPSDSQAAIQERLRIESLHDQLSLLPMKMRLPLKLYFGLDLDLKELHNLTMQSGDPGGIAVHLKKYREKKEKNLNRQLSLIHRAARLNYLIHSESGNEVKIQLWISLKKRIELKLKKTPPVISLNELSQIFRLNKSTMCRRIKRAMLEIEAKEREVMNCHEDTV